MNEDDYILDPLPEGLGVQDDGEPVVSPDPKVDAPEGVKPEGEPKEGEPPEQPHKKTGSQRARERAEREAALRMQVERERDELKAKLEGLNKPVVDPDEPKLEDFEDLASWKSALTEHTAKKAAAEAEARLKADQQKREFEAKQASWREADAKFAATTPDWDDALEDLQEAVQAFTPQNAPGFGALDAALSDSDIAPALKYHLGKHPDELRAMAALDPIGAVKAIARLEAQLTEKKTPPPPQKTNAPKPAAPVSSPSAPPPADDGRLVLY